VGEVELLADAAWQRRLAVSLASNADDLVQESWIAAGDRRAVTDGDGSSRRRPIAWRRSSEGSSVKRA
jgi:hypothetical protein